MKRTSSPIVASLALVALLAPVVACRSAAQSGDDIARIVARTGQSRRSVTVVIDDAARASTRSSDDLASVLASAAAPSETAIANTTERLSVSGVVDDVAKGVMCDVLAEIAVDPEGVTRDELVEMVISNLVATVGGTGVGWALTADGIADDISSGTAGSALWARATLLKLRHCS